MPITDHLSPSISQQKEVEALKKSLEEHEAEIQRVQRALADANKLLDNTSQPHELLVSAVRGRDEELRYAIKEPYLAHKRALYRP